MADVKTLSYDEAMFRIKICGVTTVDDALDAAAAGADAIGLNFYAQSKRYVPVDAVRPISLSMPAAVTRVGLFVNATADDITTIVEQVELDCVQLHGDEPPELIADLPRRVSVVRAYRCGEEGLAPLGSYLAACRAQGRLPDAVLIDADAPGEFGGSGRVADWALIARERELVGDRPLILAGGLSAANVARAIEVVRPDGVDVTSGVEREPGHKDAALVTQFVAAAREAFAKLQS